MPTGEDPRQRLLRLRSIWSGVQDSRPGAPQPQPQQPTNPLKGPGVAIGAGLAMSNASELDQLMAKIAKQESGGNYGARNKSSGAAGKYQIMPGNIPSWSKAALGRVVSLQEFMANPAIQDAIAKYQLGQYLSKYGAAGAAAAWYGGEGAVRGSAKYRNKPQGAYPSINNYVSQVMGR